MSLSRWSCFVLLLSFLTFLAGCGGSESKDPAPRIAANVAVDAKDPGPGPAVAPVGGPAPAKVVGEAGDFEPPPLVFSAPTDANSEKYDASLAEALTLLADQKYAQALESFETARAFKDTEFVRGEIARLKVRVEQDTAAEKTVADIETVLEQGKSEEAAQLLTRALHEFGDRDVGEKLVTLRVRNEALLQVDSKVDEAARFQRLRDEGTAALRDQNLRAAAIAFEQALQIREDVRLRDDVEEIRERLKKYDAFRKEAADMRRDSQQLEAAIDLLVEAAKAWDTLQVRQELDEYRLALQRRRDTLSIADFEIGADLGFGDAGRAIAEELLPHFKARFDLVERGQLGKVVDELNLDRSFHNDPEQQREVGRLARVRYLVLGSVRRLGQIVVQARLVDARSGLIVQTARITANSIDQVLPRLGEVSRQLLMSDEEKMAFEQDQLRQVQRIEPVPEDAPLPPPPVAQETPFVQPMPLFEPAPPPPVAGLTIQQFTALPPPPPVVQTVVVAEPPPPVFRRRMLHSVLHLGDGLFRQGQYREAHRQFEFALSLAPNDFDIRLRLERCQPLLPPPAQVVVVEQAPVYVVRPRLALLNFLVIGNPVVVPPSLSTWTPAHMAPYLRAQYDIVDSGEVYWMMGRLGMSVGDVMNDPSARRWLGRALNVQAFLLGTIEQTGSFDVSTYLLNAEHGFAQGSARIHVHHPFELKLRLAELSQVTLMPAAQRTVYLAQDNRFDVLLTRGRETMGQRQFGVAINVFEDALRLRPGNLQVMVYLNQARSAQRNWEIEEARRLAFARQQALAEQARRRQWELAQAAEAARLRSVRPGVSVDLAIQDQQRATAYGNLVTQARVAVRANNFSLAVSLFKGALDVVPPPGPPGLGVVAPPPRVPVPHDALLQELAQARAAADRANQQKLIAQKVAAQEAAVRQQREKELAVARARIQEEQRKAQAKALADKQVAETKYQAAFDQGQLLMSQGKYESAVVALQAARQLKKTETVEALLNIALQRQAEATAKNDTEKQALEAKLAAARQRARAAEEETKRVRALYEESLRQGQQALVAKNYDVAETHFTTASKYFKTDATLAGLRQVSTARAAMAATQKENQEKTNRAAQAQQLLVQGKAAFDAGNFADSVRKLQQARKLEPANLEVIASLTRAEQAQARAQAEMRRKNEDSDREKNFQRLFASGQANLQSKQYAAAVASLTEALRFKQNDPAATAALAQAQKLVASQSAKAKDDLGPKMKQYQKLIGDGRFAMTAKRYDEAVQAFDAAHKLLPGDKASADFLEDARSAQQAVQAAALKAAQAKVAQVQRQKQLQAALAEGRAALSSNDFAGARKAFQRADAMAPGDPTVAAALRDVETSARHAQEKALANQKANQQYQALVDAGRNALAGKRYAEAVKSLQSAATMRPGDPQTRALLQQAQAGLGSAQAAKALDAKVDAVVAAGRAALKKGDLNAAAASFNAARSMAPNDPDVLQALRELEAARTAGEQQRAKAFNDLVDQGRKAMAAKNYDAAVKALQQAVKMQPGDAQASLLLRQANQAQDAEEQEGTAYRSALAGAQKMLALKNYPEAARLAQQALKIRPNDPQAIQVLQQLQIAQQNAKAAEAKAASAKAAEAAAQRFQALVNEGRRLLAEKKFAQAVAPLNEAAKLAPNDPTAATLLRQAQQGAAEEQADQKKKATHTDLVQAGQRLMAQKKYAEAIQALQAARSLYPTDPLTNQLIQQATMALTPPPQPKQPQPKQPAPLQPAVPKQPIVVDPKAPAKKELDAKERYQIHIAKGQELMQMRNFPQAARHFEVAVQLFPGDPVATKLLQRARTAK